MTRGHGDRHARPPRQRRSTCRWPGAARQAPEFRCPGRSRARANAAGDHLRGLGHALAGAGRGGAGRHVAGLWVGDVVVNDVSEARLGATDTPAGDLTVALTRWPTSACAGSAQIARRRAGRAQRGGDASTLSLPVPTPSPWAAPGGRPTSRAASSWMTTRTAARCRTKWGWRDAGDAGAGRRKADATAADGATGSTQQRWCTTRLSVTAPAATRRDFTVQIPRRR